MAAMKKEVPGRTQLQRVWLHPSGEQYGQGYDIVDATEDHPILYETLINHEGGTKKPFISHRITWTSEVAQVVPEDKAQLLAQADLEKERENGVARS